MIINKSELSAEALRGIAEQHVLTFCNPDDAEMNFEHWVDKTIKQIQLGELLIEFSEHHESVRLIDKDALSDDE